MTANEIKSEEKKQKTSPKEGEKRLAESGHEAQG